MADRSCDPPDEGIDQYSERLRPANLDVKARLEDRLLKLASETPPLNVFSVRPAAITANTHDAIKPYIKQPIPLTKKIADAITPLLKWFAPHMVTSSEDLGSALVQLAIGDGADLKVQGATHGGRVIGTIGIANLITAK